MKQFILGSCVVIFSFYIPVVPMILIAVGAILLDTIFGLYTSWYLKTPLLSNKFARILIKFILYTTPMLVTYPLDVYLIDSCSIEKWGISMLLTKLITIIVVSIEGFSIDEKIRKFNNDKGISFFVSKIYTSLLDLKRKITSLSENNTKN